jgi:uncharacterized membrane protein
MSNDTATDKYRPISSTSTLFWRLFVPIFSVGMLTCFCLVFWLTPSEDLYLSVPILWVRIGLLVAWALLFWFVRSTLWRLRRVDTNDTHFVVTDYWTSVRYAWADVERTSESRHLGRRVAHIHLRGVGRFGSKISFLPASHYAEWLSNSTLKFSTLALLLFSLGACESGTSGSGAVSALTQQAQQSPQKAYVGHLRMNNGTWDFFDCASEQTYSVLDSTGGRLNSLYKEACAPCPIPSEEVYALVQARLSTANPTAALSIIKIDSIGPITMLTTDCDAYSFWCSGTEPFWSMRISQTGNAMYYKHMALEDGKLFECKPPTVKGDKEWTYTGVNKLDPTESIKLVISKEPGSDGMSDMKYNYTCIATFGDNKLKGVAVRKGESLPTE